MNYIKKSILILLLCGALLVCTCCAFRLGLKVGLPRAASTLEKAIENILDVRQNCVRYNDRDTFLETITNLHPTYMQEQANWFDAAIKSGLREYSLSLEKFKRLDGNYAYADIREAYILEGRTREIVYPAVFYIEKNNDGYFAKDCGYDFLRMQKDHIILYYTQENQEIAQSILNYAIAESNRVCSAFEYQLNSDIIINLYPNKQAMAASIKPTLPDWAGGWVEENESIKMCRYPLYKAEDYARTVAHEIVHLILFDISGGNASLWLHEGLASLFEFASFDITDYDRMILNITQDLDSTFDFETLQYIEYEKIDNTFVAGGYYASAKVAAKLIIDMGGINAVKDICSVLKMFEKPNTSNIKDLIGITSWCTANAITNVLGISLEDFAAEYSRIIERIIAEDS